jgi:O-acetyl-ADP-ribose deacetylase
VPPRPRAPTIAEIKARVMQYLVNESMDGLIDSFDIVSSPTMHAKLVLTPRAVREGQRIKLLETAPRDGVQFAATYVAAEYGDDLRDQRFTLIYPKERPEEACAVSALALAGETNNHAGKTSVLKRIRELSIDVTMLDIFPNCDIGDNHRSRPHDEWFFFSKKVWDFVDQESKIVAPGIMVHPAKKIEKSIVRLEGPDYLVKLAQQYLLHRTGGLLFKFVTISKQTRCSELTDVLKRAFSDILAEKAAAVAANDTPTCAVAAGVPNAAYFWKKVGDDTAGVSLVALPERRQQWQAMVRTALNVVTTFRKITVNMTGHQPNVLNKYLREFPNMVFPYDKTTKMLTLAGTTESVEAAERYIRQSIADENPVSRSVDCMDLIDGDLLCQFFKLDCMKNKLLDLRNTLANRFVGKDGRKRVSCEVTADSDRVAVLQVFGPQEVINDAAEVAKDGLVDLAQDLKLCVMSDLKDWDVEWLQANAGEVFESANDVVVGMHTASSASANEDASVKCSCMIGDIEVLVVCCDFLQTGIVYGCDALVNSANSTLSHGGGIARAIADAAGPGMLAECGDRHVPVGRAITTGAYDLNIHGFVHIVHAVAPIMTQGTPDLHDGMQRAVKSALMEARVAGSKGVAIPGIGMGIFGWSAEEAAQGIVSAISEWAGSYGVSSPVSPLHQSECGLRRIVLFDKDPDCAAGFVRALQALADSQTDVADASTFDAPLPVATVIAPVAAPDIPTHQWFWTVWKHEVQGKPENLVKTRTSENGLVCCVIPYDYDQNVLIENAFARNESGLELIGDLNGIANGKKYAISFEHMTQTTIPIFNDYSVRPIYRVPVTDPVASLPLYKEHLAKHQADVERTALGLVVVDDSVVPLMPSDLYFGPFMKGNYQWHSRTSRPRNGIVLFGKQSTIQMCQQCPLFVLSVLIMY